MRRFLGQLTLKELALQTWRHAQEHEVFTRANSISYLGITTMAPLLWLLLTITLSFLPDLTIGDQTVVQAAAAEHLREVLREFLPQDIYQLVADQIARYQASSPYKYIFLGIGITLWTSSGLNGEIINSLNKVYGVVERRAWWRVKLRAIGMTITQVFMLFALVALFVDWPHLVGLFGIEAASTWITSSVKWLAVFLVLLASFALTFHFGPCATHKHRWATPGTVFGAVMFILQSYGFKFFVENVAHYNALYGSLGGVLALLFWLYLSSLVFLISAEMNRIWEYAVENRHGRAAEDHSLPTDIGE